MSLIKCPDCGKEVSDRALNCPICGFPISKFRKENDKPSSTGLNVCPKCGMFIFAKEKCPDCNTTMVNCHCTEPEWTDMLLDNSLKNWEKKMREKYVIYDKEFDEIAYTKRLQEEEIEDSYYENLINNSTKNQVLCPYCHSNRTDKIKWLDRLGSVELWGLGSSLLGKQFHCNNCGADF